ncbi:MAG: hypothetical protein J7623_30465 [Chitinophaga sp.]|uniref:hypothetical protein n=1 Tax=Chitinophaga sp. TaxID=1869181 RepID=UPI001B1D8A69|nr:hypothetical protein [Chitinophaga sp.]MBO9733005.1 hypothetical protein [Chitinophaga sp.]
MKKIPLIHYGFLLLTVFMGACEKDEPAKPAVFKDESTITWTVDGTPYTAGGNSAYTQTENKTGPTSGLTKDNSHVLIVFNGKQPGTFKMGDAGQAGQADIQFSNGTKGKSYGNSYIPDCQQGGFKYADGEVTITKIGKPFDVFKGTGGYVEGTFTATLYEVNTCGPNQEHVRIKGEFKLLNISDPE